MPPQTRPKMVCLPSSPGGTWDAGEQTGSRGGQMVCLPSSPGDEQRRGGEQLRGLAAAVSGRAGAWQRPAARAHDLGAAPATCPAAAPAAAGCTNRGCRRSAAQRGVLPKQQAATRQHWQLAAARCSHGVGAVVMKNWLPLVSGPELACGQDGAQPRSRSRALYRAALLQWRPPALSGSPKSPRHKQPARHTRRSTAAWRHHSARGPAAPWTARPPPCASAPE